MKKTAAICTILFVGFLVVILAQTVFKWFPESKLYGEPPGAKKPPFMLSSWLDGKFQKEYEQWFNRRVGFRSALVRMHNQVNFSLFREISAKTRNPIILGKSNWLYSRPFIQAYVAPRQVPQWRLRQIVEGLRQFQDHLEQRHIACLLLISPSKAEIYPEYIPSTYTARRSDQRTSYERIVPLLNQHEIRYLDAHQMFLALKKTSPHKLFPRGGTHWNHYGAFLMVKRVLKELKNQIDKDIPIPVCKSVILDRPRGRDNDLGDLINIWTKRATQEPTPYPNLETAFSEQTYLPNILFVGDSFVNRLTDLMDGEKLYRKRDSIFYFRTLKSYRSSVNLPLKRQHIDWEQMLLARDAVVIEINEIHLPKIGFGFIQAALKYLQANHVQHKESAGAE